MNSNSKGKSTWVQAMPFVPGDSQSPFHSSFEFQPSSLHSTEDVDQGAFQDQLQTQLKREREQHAVTKHLLRCEQEKARKLQRELQDSKHLASTIAEASRLNARILQVATNRTQPEIEKMKRKIAVLDAALRLPSDNAVDADGDLQSVPGNSVHGSKTFSPQLPVSRLVNPRPSILYDVLAQQKVGELDTVPEFHSSFENIELGSAVQQTTHQPNEAQPGKQNLLNTQPQQPLHYYVRGGDSSENLDQLESRASAEISEFHSLDEAFDSDFFSEREKVSKSSFGAPEKATSDNALIEILPRKHGSFKPGDVGSASSQVGLSLLAQPPSSGEDCNNNTQGAAVFGERKAIGGPTLDVQHMTPEREQNPIPLQVHNEPWKTPSTLSSLPTLHLPSSFLARAVNYKASTASSSSSDSDISPRLGTMKGSGLALTEVPPRPVHTQVKTLQNVKMSETSNSSEDTLRPGSAQRRAMDSFTMPESGPEQDPSSLMRTTSREATAPHDVESTGSSSYLWPGDSVVGGNAMIQRIRPSSGVGDNYNVIPVEMTNYLEVIDWKMNKDLNGPFHSDLEKDVMQRCQFQSQMRHSPFWLHPVRYLPSIHEPNIYRTVQIDHIPKGSDVRDVLDKVCWGIVESIQLVDVGNIRGPQGPVAAPYKFARIVFFKENQACKFQRYAHKTLLTILGQQVRVYVQIEPTYPRLAEVDEALFEKEMTRILSVFGLTDDGRDQLPAFLQRQGVELISLEARPHDNSEDEDDHFGSKTVMEFRSVLHAFRALKAMQHGGYPHAAGFMVEPDYCARGGRR